MNVGSAVTGPEVYLKALAMARNVAHQGQKNLLNFTRLFDMIPIDEDADIAVAPGKEDYRYYFRPWKTILSRTIADGGKSYYICGDHGVTVPNIAHRLLNRE